MYNDKKKIKTKKKSQSDSSSFLNKFFHKRTKRLLTDIDRLFRKIMTIEIAISVVFVLIGVIFLIWPSISVQVLSVLCGIFITCFGVYNLYCYSKRSFYPLFKFHLVYGILSLLLGVLTIINPFTFSQVITIFIGMWVLYLAVLKIDLSLRLKVIGESSWLLLLVSSLLEVFMSIIIFINPFSNLLITQVVGSFLILCGILNTMDAILTKNRALDFLDNIM